MIKLIKINAKAQSILIRGITFSMQPCIFATLSSTTHDIRQDRTLFKVVPKNCYVNPVQDALHRKHYTAGVI